MEREAGESLLPRGARIKARTVAQIADVCAPQVAPATLAAIAATESGFDPLAILDDTTHATWRPRDRGEALGLARELIGAGHSVDLGLMQVNSGNLGLLNLKLSQAFDPCASLRAGAEVLAAGYEGGKTRAARQAALRMALSRYNTGGPQAGFRNGYVSRVVAAAKWVVPEIESRSRAPADAGAVAPASPAGAMLSPHSPDHLQGKGHRDRHWEVFRAVASSAQPDAAPGSNWNVFPQSVGPGRLADRPPVKGTGRPPSPAGTSKGGSHE